MTVTGIGGQSPWYGVGAANDSSWQTRMQQMMGPVAQLFGESPQQLMSDLQSGHTSLSALAQSKGVSQTDLVNTIQQGLQQSTANGGPQLSSTQLTNLANTIANRVHGGHHGHHHVRGAGAASGVAGATDSDGDNDGSGAATSGASGSSGALKTDVEQLIADLQAAQAGSAPGTSPTADLLTQLTQFDQTL